MALERLGLGAIVKFDGSQAERGMGRLGGAVTGLSKRVKAAGSSMASGMTAFGSGMARTGAALLPFTAAVGFATKQAADFEQKMSNVKAITGATGKDFNDLQLKAKQMGATTVFSASQSADAMEALSRAGFNTQETIKGIGGVASAAAADSIPLATSAGIIASTIRGMGLEAGEAARVADVLAKTSQRTNTDIIDLGEGLKYATPVARTLGITLPELTTAMGAMADAGVRGSMSGTAMKNALLALSKPSDAAKEHLAKLGVGIHKTADGSLDLFATFADLSENLDKISDKTEKAAILQDIFGKRGTPAFTAVASAMKQAEGDGTKFTNLLGELNKEMTVGGAAAKAAETRLDNLNGTLTLLKSAIEGFSIETMSGFLEGSKSGLKSFTKGLGDVVTALQLLNGGIDKNDERWKGLGGTAIAIAEGIKEGLDAAKWAIVVVKNAVVSLFKRFGGDGKNTTKMIAKIATLFVLVAAAIAPVLVALGGVAAFIGTVIIPIITAAGSGILGAIGGALLTIAQIALPVFAVLAAGFLLIRNDGESVGDTLIRVFNMIKAAIMYVIDNAVKPFAETFYKVVRPAIEMIKAKVMDFIRVARANFQALLSGVIQAFNRLKPFFIGLFKILGAVIGTFAKWAIRALGFVLDQLKPILRVVKTIGIWIVEKVVNGLITLVKAAIKVADALGKSEWIPKELRDFVKGGEFKIDQEMTVETAAFGPETKKPTEVAANVAAASTKKEAAAGGAPNVNVDLEVNDDRKLSIETPVVLDGKQIAKATAKNQIDVDERQGFKTTPWQKRVILEQGAITLPQQG